MNYYFITGISRGIGKALTEELLKKEDNYIIGFGRTNSLKHERFEFIEVDLTNIDLIKNYQFIDIIDAESICLINNAGMLGDIDNIGKVKNQSIIDVFNLNSIAPALLINNFIRSYQNFEGKKVVLNISSGAGRHTIDSWSAYCSSKSALDMFSEVVNSEQFSNSYKHPVKILSVAPGIVDTDMQSKIRTVDKNRFKDIEKFINYKKENLLSSPKQVAHQLIKVIEKANEYEDVLLDLRNLHFQ